LQEGGKGAREVRGEVEGEFRGWKGGW
jgi:hypothetical protein